MYRSTLRAITMSLFALAGACVSEPVPATRPPMMSPPTTRTSQPPLTPLSDMDAMYFGRATRFDVVNGEVVVLDPSGTRRVTMDPLPELIFSWADGKHTVTELLERLATQYEDGPPPDFNNQVRFVIHSLEREGMIRLNPTAITLPSYLALPASQQNPAETPKEMQHDAVGEPQRGTDSEPQHDAASEPAP